MMRKIFLLSLLPLNVLALDIEATVVGSHEYIKGKPLLLKEVDLPCYYMSVIIPDGLEILGKSCTEDYGVETFKVHMEGYVNLKFPTKGGELLSFKIDSITSLEEKDL